MPEKKEARNQQSIFNYSIRRIEQAKRELHMIEPDLRINLVDSTYKTKILIALDDLIKTAKTSKEIIEEL